MEKFTTSIFPSKNKISNKLPCLCKEEKEVDKTASYSIAFKLVGEFLQLTLKSLEILNCTFSFISSSIALLSLLLLCLHYEALMQLNLITTSLL